MRRVGGDRRAEMNGRGEESRGGGEVGRGKGLPSGPLKVLQELFYQFKAANNEL